MPRVSPTRMPAAPLAGIAADGDLAAGHARAGEHAGIAFHLDLAALHAGAEIGAGIALDDDLAFCHAGADLVAATVGAGEAERLGILALHLEAIADG